MVMIFFTSSSLHLIVCQQLKLSMCAVYQSMLSCPKPKRHRFTMFMSRKFGSRSNRLAGYKGYLLGWNQLGNNKMSLQTDPRQINLKLFIQYQNIMLNLQLYHFSYVIMYNNYVIRQLHIIKLQLIINRGKYISKLATDWLRCVLFFFCHLSLLCTTQYIRPFSVVQEGSYKVRKKGMQTNLTDFFSSFRKVFSRFFFKTRIREKGRFLPKPAQPNLYCKGNKPITKNHTVMFTYWKVADDDSDQLKDQEQIFWVLWRIETNFIMYKKFDEFNTTSDIIINVTAYS